MLADQVQNIFHRNSGNFPVRHWKYYQEWQGVVFLHWQVTCDRLKGFVPGGLEIDLFEGVPWVSLVAFEMNNIRRRYLPAFKPVSNFIEVNLRTYVKYGDQSGVYFLSLEGSKWLSCLVSRLLSGLPYRYSGIENGGEYYDAENSETNSRFLIHFSPGTALSNKTDLDTWLTERYALLQGNRRYDLYHEAWPLQELHIEHLEASYPGFNELVTGKPDKAHYSKGLQVVAW